MKIIVLEGFPNKGKTETINLVHDLVINNGGLSTSKIQRGADPRDFEDIVINYKNKKIGFLSMGDNSTEISEAVSKFHNANCDLMICALSTGTPKIRANNAINKHKNTRVPKSITINSGLFLNLNMSDAQRIFSLI